MALRRNGLEETPNVTQLQSQYHPHRRIAADSSPDRSVNLQIASGGA